MYPLIVRDVVVKQEVTIHLSTSATVGDARRQSNLVDEFTLHTNVKTSGIADNIPLSQVSFEVCENKVPVLFCRRPTRG